MPRSPPADLAVILAAGGGARMGRPKGLLEQEGTSLLARHAHALAGHAREVVAVIGARPDAHRAILDAVGVPWIENAQWATTWPIDSLALALAGRDPATTLVTPVDVSPADPRVLDALLSVGAPAVPRGPGGVDGHPVLIDRDVARAVGTSPAGGLRVLLADARRVDVDVPGIEFDYDTPEDWSRHGGRGGG